MELCRACLASCPWNWHNLTAEQYTYCTNLQIPEDDVLPKTLCLKCYSLIDQFYCFKKLCIQSEQTLLYSIKNKNENDVQVKDESNDVGNTTDDPDNTDIIVDEITFDFPISSYNSEDLDNKDSVLEESQKIVFDVSKEKVKKRKRRKKSILLRKSKRDNSIPKKKYPRKSRAMIKNFPCSQCHRRYTTSEKLDRHISKFHLKFRDYVCDICGKCYDLGYGIKYHRHTDDVPRTHECLICHKKYKTELHLNSHMTRHKVRTIFCDVCNLACQNKGQLKKHELIHKGIKPATCNICNKSFSSHSFMKVHQRTHTGEKPYNCDVCTMSFISMVRLSEHKRTHTGEKPFKCIICNHAFAQCGTMKRHMKTHVVNLN